MHLVYKDSCGNLTAIKSSGKKVGASNSTATVRVSDALGRLIEIKTRVAANSTIEFGDNYRPGIYFTQVIQGGKLVTLKLVKQ